MLFKSSFKRLIFALPDQLTSAASHCYAYLSATICDKVPQNSPIFVRQMANCFVVFLLPSWQIRRLSYQAPVLREVFSLLRVSRHNYTSGIPEELSVYAHTTSRSGSGPDSSQHFKLSCVKALLCLSFQCRRICEGFQLYVVFRSDNFEKNGSQEHFK